MVVRIARLLITISKRMRQRTYKWKLGLEAFALLKQYRVGANVILHAPVKIRCMHAGILGIGNGCILGFEMAPRSGNGELLLQPRHCDALIKIGSGVI